MKDFLKGNIFFSLVALILIFILAGFQDNQTVKYIMYALSGYVLFVWVIGTIGWIKNLKSDDSENKEG